LLKPDICATRVILIGYKLGSSEVYKDLRFYVVKQFGLTVRAKELNMVACDQKLDNEDKFEISGLRRETAFLPPLG